MDSGADVKDTYCINSYRLGESVTLKMNQIRLADAVVFTPSNLAQKAINFMNCYNF